MITLLLALALASPTPRYMTRECSRVPGGRSDRGMPCDTVSYADFELAPTTGAGMTAECACADVTGASGQTVTWARSSSAYCTKEGLATTGLTTTSLVLCSTNQPRVEATGNGAKGLRREAAATNLYLRSEELNTAPNVAFTSGSSITVTANAGTAPNNTATADRIAFGAVTSGKSAQLYQDIAITSGVTYTFTLHVQSESGGLTQYQWVYDSVADVALSTCNYTTSTITRCQLTFTAVRTATARYHFGNNKVGLVGTGDTAASTVLAWGFQVEVGPAPTSYIATTSGTATRNADTVTATLSPSIAAATGSFSAKVWIEGAISNSGILGLHNNTAGTFDTIAHNNATTVDLYVGGVAKTSTVPIPDAGVFFSTSGFWGASTSLTVNGATVTGTAAAAGATLDRLTVGSYVGGNVMSGIFSEICADDDATRCQ